MMKKIILCLTLAWMSATTMFAVKAKPGITSATGRWYHRISNSPWR